MLVSISSRDRRAGVSVRAGILILSYEVSIRREQREASVHSHHPRVLVRLRVEGKGDGNDPWRRRVIIGRSDSRGSGFTSRKCRERSAKYHGEVSRRRDLSVVAARVHSPQEKPTA